VVAQQPDWAEAHYMIGLTYLFQGEYQKALTPLLNPPASSPNLPKLILNSPSPISGFVVGRIPCPRSNNMSKLRPETLTLISISATLICCWDNMIRRPRCCANLCGCTDARAGSGKNDIVQRRKEIVTEIDALKRKVAADADNTELRARLAQYYYATGRMMKPSRSSRGSRK
jgi:hypothetical protein